ncbi:Essential protein Yae1 [Penicillium alfredii]|uniref:Protein YAE1 n=1 Tax=Penicillium alfredii TaxID=1506179 RepID=A0A9W9GAA0_9EURO|nr:Essential protein Yae1 [Penicillium alfredii]KAJ5114829.1 Essential protein Yae1 [Penicillium alfredii]
MTSTHTDSSSAPSAPSSPATIMTSTQTDTATQPAVDNSLDDIFGSSPPRDEVRHAVPERAPETATTAEPSDLPSLRRQHVTAGYRDGVATSKGEHVQSGFDAGFPVGAQLGMRAGTVLGIMEGILRGLEERSGYAVKKPEAQGVAGSSSTSDGPTSDAAKAETRRQKKAQVLKLYQLALKDLDVQSVFTGGEAGAGAGTPAEIVPSGQAGERAETQLARKGDVAISKWEGRVAVPRWEENMEALEEKENQGAKTGDKGGTIEQS